MSEKMLVRYTLFNARPKVGGRKLYPLAAGRLLVLEELGNPLGTGAGGDSVDTMAVYEAFLVASMDAEELEEATRDRDAWRRQVRTFSLDFPDADLNAFWQIIQDELEEAASKMTVPAKTAGKRASAGKKRVSRRKK